MQKDWTNLCEAANVEITMKLLKGQKVVCLVGEYALFAGVLLRRSIVSLISIFASFQSTTRFFPSFKIKENSK